VRLQDGACPVQPADPHRPGALDGLRRLSRLFDAANFAVDFSICPEQIVTDYIVKLIEFPEALQVLEFADGLVSLVAVRAFEGGPLVGHPLKDIRKHIPQVDARIAAIFRRDTPVTPEGDTVIEAGDEVFCLAATKDIRRSCASCGAWTRRSSAS
jgi:trk system potassium uptake protein TrkA